MTLVMTGAGKELQRKVHWLVLYLALQVVVVIACVLLRQVAPPLPPEAYRLDSVSILGAAQNWEPVALPDHPATAGITMRSATYRASFSRPPEQEGVLWSVFVPRFTTGVEFSVNGTVIADTRRDPATLRPDRNIAAISVIPENLIRVGENELVMRLFIWGPLSGYIDSVYVGPDDVLRAPYNLRTVMFVTIPLILVAWQVTLGVILGIIWLNRRQEQIYGYLGAGMTLGVAFYSLGMPTSQWMLGIVGATVPFEAALMFHYVLLFTGRAIPRWHWLVFLPGVLIAAAGAFGSPAALHSAYLLLGPSTVGALLATVCLLLARAAWQGRKSAIYLGTAFTAVFACWAVDALTIQNLLPGERLFLGRLSYSVVLIVLGIWLTWRFVQALNDADGFAERLVRQVSDAEAKLRASFVREEERTRIAALAAERTRLMRDLHDGLGGQLVSIVALAEQSGNTTHSISDAARAALRDLRLVIDAMEEIDGDLMLALGSWRERISGQLRAHGIDLVWSVATPGGLPVYPSLRPRHVIQLVRLLDEAVTNAIKHSGATILTVSIEAIAGDDGVPMGRISVADNGHGFAVGDERMPSQQPGRGMLNMKKRAALCGVELSIVSQPTGTVVALSLPTDFPEPAQAG